MPASESLQHALHSWMSPAEPDNREDLRGVQKAHVWAGLPHDEALGESLD
jgi:hypothetical protein